jgi:pyruvate ferredoxin oxidoreductase gamma subunit
MIEIRLHGRGGQGAVTAAEILAVAGFLDGKMTQAFPRFGPERRNAPVEAYCRFDNEFISLRAPINEPDCIVVLDPGLMELGAKDGLKPNGIIVINSDKSSKASGHKVYRIDATSIATKILGRPIVNTAMLGVIAKTGLVSLQSILTAISQRMPQKIVAKNQDAVKQAYDACIIE